jgi:uncharacterized membrane protein YdbT with pleckstrin-like domain
MNYEDIWQKTLSKDEKVEFEFSIGNRYRKFGIIAMALLGLLFLMAAGLGIVIFLIGLFYYGFYLPKANAYAFTNKRVLIHRGWLSTRTVAIDYPKITDIHVAEPFLDKIFYHTGNIAVNTAGTNTLYEVVLRHVEHPYEIKKKLDELKDETYGRD